MSKGFFITGTDTEIGKTFCAVGLLRKFSERGLSTIGLKPVACGADLTKEGLRNEDALHLAHAATHTLPYPQINPYCFAQPIAPHIAARENGVDIDLHRIASLYYRALQQADVVIVEGAGGWEVPLDQEHTLADLAGSLTHRIILVVGMRLGCLNHALLTANAIRRAGLQLSGWIANSMQPSMPHFDDNVTYLRTHLHAPCLGVIPYLGENTTAHQATEYLDIAMLLDS